MLIKIIEDNPLLKLHKICWFNVGKTVSDLEFNYQIIPSEFYTYQNYTLNYACVFLRN